MKRLVLLIGLVIVAPGCSDHKSVLDEGARRGPSSATRVVSAAEARQAGRSSNATWERELRTGARQHPKTKFPNLPPAELRRRLDLAAKELDFKVVSFELLHPRQLAPRIVVRTTHYLRLARATNHLLGRLDPRKPTSDDRKGWRYEGFYFRAEDENGVPFLIVYNFWRGVGSGGGQWARSERLYPFAHG